MRIWLHEGADGGPGFIAWCLDLLGFATWAPTRQEVLSRTPAKAAAHAAWLSRHGLGAPALEPDPVLVEERRGNEILFDADRAPAAPEEVLHAIRLLACTRADLLDAVRDLPAATLAWDPPYRRFAPWASWRKIPDILRHVANSETHYYLPAIGYRSPHPPAGAGDDPHAALDRSREETITFLRDLGRSEDRERTGRPRGEPWSVRKVLRRLVRHELLHERSIRRIVAAHEEQARGA